MLVIVPSQHTFYFIKREADNFGRVTLIQRSPNSIIRHLQPFGVIYALQLYGDYVVLIHVFTWQQLPHAISRKSQHQPNVSLLAFFISATQKPSICTNLQTLQKQFKRMQSLMFKISGPLMYASEK